MKKQFKIVDWMNNRIFPDKAFSSFEHGWEYIYSKFDNEEDHQEYFVVDINEKESGQIWKIFYLKRLYFYLWLQALLVWCY